ncbi:tRNA uridine-5-carboxymethylaminomethyl(34) synthesis GTPase MnmE [Marinospirillum insulare]|uniref:tRNA modification GTPase MnmE n=1 Tax=Marinospirillum insulare TaxID=217169 RepID=A0ABQ6A1Q4_9GAMM|nr:tRNA uridine-5-carboxymethylaminomethyl(34) synthesis GTPase MnmE [Marinospirillum insulare]GLR64846.1 tRNA modification GTPase MnmE [Marinospirillum insulare]
MSQQDTIAAVATPPGRGGVGIVRVSGSLCLAIAKQLLGRSLSPRHAHYLPFYDAQGEVIDEGLAIYFPGPNSFTGEDVLEFQGHGGPVLLDRLLENLLQLGVRLAQPGEFSQRAFLNDKLDLAQAEAIADMIDASSRQAAENALKSLQGVFSQKVHGLVDKLIHLRMYVEAAIDFPEEEIDFISDGKVKEDLYSIIEQLEAVKNEAQQGFLMREGMNVVLAGKPNAGKSSLMNALAGYDKALVTEIAGTTRDVLKEQIHIDGMPLHLIDTAGLRETDDLVEQLGVERAWKEIEQADRILLMVDAQETKSLNPLDIWPEFVKRLPHPERLTLVRNKIDLTSEVATADLSTSPPVIRIAAKQLVGVDNLRKHLKEIMGFQNTTEGGFSARRRHLDALQRASHVIHKGKLELEINGAGELLAEDLRSAQESLSEITGQFSADDLLGKIFGEFCIGK